MDRAGKAMRVSASKLIFSSSPHEADLSNALSQFNAVVKATRSLSEIQANASEALMKWSLNENNASIKDVAFQTNELINLWTRAQIAFADKIESSLTHLKEIQCGTKEIALATKKVNHFKDKESKLGKDIGRAQKWRKGGDVRLLEHDQKEARAAVQRAVTSRDSVITELEVAKMFRLKEGLQEVSDAHLQLAMAAQCIFSAHREVAEYIPSIDTQDVHCLAYNGGIHTRAIVERSRRQLAPLISSNDNRRRRSEPTPNSIRRGDRERSSVRGNAPPPPYAPTDPIWGKGK